MKTHPLRIVILLVWAAILAVLGVAGTHPAAGQASKQVLSVPTMADLEARIPQTPSETIEVQHGSSSNRWAAPRLFVLATSSETADRVFVVTNRTAGTRYIAADRSNGVFDVRHFGAIPNVTVDSTPAITAAAAALQAAGGGTLLVPHGTYSVSKVGPVAHFANISNVSIAAENAVFTESDYVDSTWTAIALTSAGTVATAVWASPHGFSPGSPFLIKDSTDVAFDGYWTVTHVDSPTQIRFNLTAYNVPSGAATALAHVSDTSHVLFRFDSCTNVNLGKLVFRGHVLPVDNQFRLGWRVVEAFRGTKGVRGELDVEGAAYGFYSGEYNVQSISGCSDLRVRVVAKNVGYPVQATGADDSAFEVVCDTVHRAGYFGGVRRSSAHIWAKNWDIVGALLTHQPDPADSRGCEDFTLRVWDTGTTVPQKLLAYGGYRHMASVAGYANTNAVKHKNLDIRVYGKNIPRGAGLIVQTYGTNHWVDGLKFGGNMDQSGLSHTNTGWPFFIYDTSPTTAGHYKDLVVEDFTWTSTTNSGAYPGYIRLAKAENDVEFNRYSTDIYTSQQLPDGIHTVTVPRFPDWSAGSFEAAQIQGIGGGIKLAETTVIVPMISSLGSNDFTVQWVGDVPTGNAGLFAITTGSSAGAGSFGASISNGDLIVRAYGASAADWLGVTATNWASALRGKVASLGIVRTATGVSIWTDGHSTAGTVTTNGTPPTWADALAGTNAYLGTDDAGSEYAGTVYRFAVFNYARGSEFPALAVRWNPGSSSSASGTSTIDEATGNGGFETLGTGGTDPFGSWTESADGSSAVTVSTNAVQGTNSLALSVDGSDSFAGVTSSETLVNGATYQITFWARVLNGTSGQIAIVGAAGGDYPITITGTWAKYSVALLWNSTSFNLKRWSLTSQTAEIDAITVQRVGALCDFDWTSSPADRVSGTFASPLGGSSTKVISRGLGISPDRGDNSANIEAGHDAPVQVWASNLTGARTANLQTNHARRGDIFRIVRTGAGAGTLTAAGLAIATDEWADFVFNGSAWQATAHGKVTGTYSGGGGTNTWKIEVNAAEIVEPDITDTSTIGWTAVGSVVSGAVKPNSLGTNLLTGAAYAALQDLGNATGTLADARVDAALARDSEVTAAIAALATVYQEDDADLAAYAALSSAGLVARTGAGTVAARTITGDSEIAVANGDGVAGNPTLSIGAAIARVAAIAAAYQPLDDDLTDLSDGTLTGSKLGAGINDDNVDFDDADGLWTATTLGAALEELNDSINAGAPNGTGAKVHWSQLLGVPAGFADGTDDGTGGGGNADTNAANAWGALQTFVGGIDASGGTNMLGVLHVTSIESDSPIGQSIGGTGGTNAASAREALGLVIGYDVQAHNANLAQLATVGWASGDMPWFDGSNLTNLATTAAGRTLLTAANAAAQWSALLSSATTNGAYNSSTWDGITDRVPNLDQIRDAINALPGGSNSITSVNTNYFTMTGGYLDWVGGSVGGGSGYTYIVTNVNGAFQSRTAGTNWVVMSTTVSSNYAPSAAGLFLEGGYGLVISNNSGTSANMTMRIKANGTIVFQDAAGGLGSGSMRTVTEDFRLVRESATTASLISVGAWVSASAGIGVGDFGGVSPLGNSKTITNITWNWATNNSLEISIACDTSTSTNDALGITVSQAFLRAEGAAGGGTGDVVGPASSTDSVVALYDGTTGKLLKDGTLTEAAINAHLTEAEASALYQRTNSFLTGLSTGDGSALTNLNASNLASGTVASNRLPSAIALTTIDAGTITATSVTGDGSGLTNLNGSNIASGTVADARIDSAITRDSEAAAAYQPLDADLTTLAINNGVNLTNINATSAFGTGTIPDARIGADVARTNSPTLHSPSLLGDPTAPTASANDNDTSIATTAYVQAEETALKAANLWQATNANLTTLAGASITGSGNFMRTRTGVPREIWIPASAMNPGSDTPTPATNAWATTTDGQRWEGWDFSATSTNSVYFTLALPTAWDGGTVKAKILWKQVVAAATATNSWQIGGGSLTDGETGGNTLGTLVEVLDVGANDTNVVSVSAASGAITIGGTPSAGHLTWFTVRRHPGDDDDNFAQLSRLLGVHLQYTETATEPSAW